MKLLKLILLLVLAVFGMESATAQSYKLTTKNFSVMEKTPRGTWGKWSDLQDAKLVGTIDTNKNRIVIYSQEVQLYTITTYGKREENDTDIIYPFICQDADGVKFTISLITRKKQNYRKQLYINHPDVIVVYNLESVTDE
ncbi:MAG: hypothetical protein IR153_00385 [Flavobacterium sp.]|nr:hypothetical protein [Flavobacterium sp.]